jgi:hypothetical protein
MSQSKMIFTTRGKVIFALLLVATPLGSAINALHSSVRLNETIASSIDQTFDFAQRGRSSLYISYLKLLIQQTPEALDDCRLQVSLLRKDLGQLSLATAGSPRVNGKIKDAVSALSVFEQLSGVDGEWPKIGAAPMPNLETQKKLLNANHGPVGALAEVRSALDAAQGQRSDETYAARMHVLFTPPQYLAYLQSFLLVFAMAFLTRPEPLQKQAAASV